MKPFFREIGLFVVKGLIFLGMGALLLNQVNINWNISSLVDQAMDEITDGAISSGMNMDEDWSKNPLLSQRKIVLMGGINEKTIKKVIEQILYLDGLAGTDPIHLYIRTTGGWLDDAFSLIEIMKTCRSPVHIYAMGICNSAGSTILTGATGKRYAYPGSMIGVHFNLPKTTKEFDPGFLRKKRFEALWKSRTKLPEDWYPVTKDVDYYIDAEEALKYGVIDEIIKPK